MIYALKNVLLIPKVLELAKTLDTDPKTLETVLIRSLGRKDAALFVYEKDGVLDGFILATIEEFEGRDAGYIQSCVIRPTVNEKNVGHELLSRIRRWVAEQGASEFYFMTRRNHKAFQRKYNLRFHATVLKGRI